MDDEQGSNLEIRDPGDQPGTPPRTEAKGMPDRTWVILEESDDIPPTGLFVGHNGTSFLIKAGVPVHLPNYVLDLLDDAVQSKPVMDQNTKQVSGTVDRRRFNYRKVDAPAEAE